MTERKDAGVGDVRPTGRVKIDHDGFVGFIIGHYTTHEGKRGVVVQQEGTLVVHVYGEKWIPAMSRCAICGGEHDNDLGTDICQRCEETAPWRDAALAKSASSPAGGDVVDEQALNAARKVYNETLGSEWKCGATERVVRAYLDALSQSTSAGRGDNHGS